LAEFESLGNGALWLTKSIKKISQIQENNNVDFTSLTKTMESTNCKIILFHGHGILCIDYDIHVPGHMNA